ncbi:hypothetical protein [Persicobacter diffluens]|uniref:Uncharacterized protein n=1 Tax=Persicobacter diffluens TaxID=981 RepID=A0AAN4W256_9BACT|nr:hypothetical protein PEDI_36720 [Persicobacter diffluens]
MKRKFFLFSAIILAISVLLSFLPQTQEAITICKAATNNAAVVTGLEGFLGGMELPFLGIALIFSFLTANRLKGGRFGAGMQLMAWGFLVMAIGHLHMQVDHFYGFNLFNTLFGAVGGQIAWFLALMVTWGLSGFGFYKIYHASKV